MRGTGSGMRRLSRLLALLPFLLAAGCASRPAPQPLVYPGKLPELEPAGGQRPVSEGSLFTDGGAAELVGDFRARHVGDVLVVRISEAALGSSSADSKLDRKSDHTLKAPVLFGWENKVKGKLGPDFDPALAFSASGEKAFEGSGETTRKAKLTARIAVRVMAVGTGGRMVVAGTKEIAVNHERQTITLAGIVRPEDIGPDNTISSSSIADLTITYGGVGDVADTTRQGWFQRLLARIWPF